MLWVLYSKLGVTSYDVLAPRPAAAAAVIATTKIGQTHIATMPTVMTLTQTTGMGGPLKKSNRDDNK
jgi:hypothetical protein